MLFPNRIGLYLTFCVNHCGFKLNHQTGVGLSFLIRFFPSACCQTVLAILCASRAFITFNRNILLLKVRYVNVLLYNVRFVEISVLRGVGIVNSHSQLDQMLFNPVNFALIVLCLK